ncbi:DNA repair and recombination protein RadA [Candidatus Woesearchaeota archaeon]|nr:DNA repair and recombination protein RadA [Candidatus Woesearchaeota archaeon]
MAEKKEIKEISVMDLPGVGAATAEKLKEAGYDSMLAIAVASPGELVELAGFTEATARKVIQASRNELKMGFESGEDLLKKRESILKLTTGSSALNTLLGGGVETGAITEFFGEFGSGKSSIAHQLAVTVQMPIEKGGMGGTAVWLDSESTFRPERIKQIASAYGLEALEVLRNIKVARCFNSDHQVLLAEKVEDLITKDKLPIKLVIVDSLMSHFRADFSGRGQLADRQQKINKHMHTLLRLATTYNVAIYVTNQVMAKPDTFFGDPTVAIGGHVLAHACLAPNTLLQLSDGTIKPIADCYDYNELVCVKLREGMLIASNKFDHFFINTNAEKIYSIDAGYKIESSPEHRFFKLSENCEIEESTTKELKIGDFVACAKRISISGKNQKLPKVSIEKIFKLTDDGKNLVYKKINDSNLTRKEFCKQLYVTPRQLRRILNQNYPTKEENILVFSDKLGMGMEQIAMQVQTNKHKEIAIPEYFTPAICQILGYFAGDGCFEDYSLRFRDQRLDVLMHYKALFKQEFNLETNIRKIKGKNCFNLDANSKSIKRLFELVDKNLITYMSKLPNEHIAAFIKGFADAEGFVDKKRPALFIGQKHELFLRCMQMLLLRIGVRSTLSKYKSSSKQEFYNLLFIGRDLVDFANKISLTADDKKQTLEKWIEHNKHIKYNRESIPISREYLKNLLLEAGIMYSKALKPRPKEYKYVSLRNLNKVIDAIEKQGNLSEETKSKVKFIKTLINGDIEWRKVRDIKQLPNKEPLYDIAVPGQENYIANGFIVHNSTYRVYLRKGKKGTRVAKIIDAPHLPESEAIFIVTEQGIKDA